MKRTQGFTLVELLVVIAIISILAAIVVPRVSDAIGKARMTKAVGEIHSVDSALTKMLSDAGRRDFRQIFDAATLDNIKTVYDPSVDPPTGNPKALQQMYTNAFYLLLRKGRDAPNQGDWPAGWVIEPEIRKKLSDFYLDLGKDPWGNLYQFWPGPWTADPTRIPFRIYQVDETVPGAQPHAGDAPDVDGENIGYYAPKTEVIYVYSLGEDKLNNQFGLGGNPTGYDGLEASFYGGGDDVNSWDNAGSWERFY